MKNLLHAAGFLSEPQEKGSKAAVSLDVRYRVRMGIKNYEG